MSIDSSKLSSPVPIIESKEQATSASDDLQNELASYGTLVHKLFEIIGNNKMMQPKQLHKFAESALYVAIDSDVFDRALNEVTRCIQHLELNEIFALETDKEIFCELPVCLYINGKFFYRIIDRLVVTKDIAHIIDYKTDKEVNSDNMQKHAKQHQDQISNYISAVKKLYPNKKIKASILFTALPNIYTFKTEAKVSTKN